jgi:putative superfamily III holin-X
MAALRAPAPSEQESVGALVQRLSTDVSRIVRAEIALVRVRAEAALRVFKAAGGGLAAAAVLLLIGLGVVMAGAVLLLATVLPAWLAAFAIGGGLLVIAAVLVAIELRVLTHGMNEALASVEGHEVEIRDGR